jgi:Mg2+-importing ATPase
VLPYLILVELTKKWFYAEQIREAGGPRRTCGREHRIHRRAARFSHAG